MILSASLLSANFANLQNDTERLEKSGVKYLHIDVMDGHFVPNITIGPLVVAALRKVCGLVFDVHLMISEPEKYIDDFIKAGADIITIHIESTVHLNRVLNLIKEKGAKAGVSLNPATPIFMVEGILNDLDMVLIMSVNPGFGGQKFIPSSLDKIKDLKDLIKKSNKDIKIEVDGGITSKNIYDVTKAGADIIVAGTAVFKDNKIEENIKNLMSSQYKG